MTMRGIVLAGGQGTRLGSLTKVVNKHLLPVAGRPMVQWPIDVLRHNNIDDITIVSTPRGIGQLAELLGGDYTYRVQEHPQGVANALMCAHSKCNEAVVVILGDNVFFPSPYLLSTDYYRPVMGGARCYLAKVHYDRLKEFGVASFNTDDSGTPTTIKHITEKPSQPASECAVTGLYMFGPDVFTRIDKVQESKRGELEITDLLNTYAHEGKLDYTLIDCFWGDAGTQEGLLACSASVRAAKEKR